MSKTIDDGGPAFPVAPIEEIRTHVNTPHERVIVDAERGYVGMSLRDYFAGQALAATRCGDWETCQQGATFFYNYADAMLNEREKTGGAE